MHEPRALWFVTPRRVELRHEAPRIERPGDVCLRALASGVSQGTELLLYRGDGPECFDPTLGDNGGAPTYPRRYGYAWVGETIHKNAHFPEGTRAFALAPHGESHVLSHAFVRPLPNDVPAPRATLAANLETAITCTWDAAVTLGDRAVVLGAGVVGVLTAWLLARSGAEVVIVERSEARRKAARVLVPNATIVDTPEPDAAADIVVEATGNPDTLNCAITYARQEGRIVVASFYGRKRASVDLGDTFHRRRLELRATQVSSIPPRLRERWTSERRWSLVLELLRNPALDALLVTVPFDDASQLYASLDTEIDLPPAHVFVYR